MSQRVFVSGGIQTDQREESTQTDPWSAPIVVRDGREPEVIALRKLTVMDGTLSLDRQTVENVLKIRQQHAFEQSLPQGQDQAAVERRIKVLAAHEAQDWKEREAEIAEAQDKRLAALEESLKARDERLAAQRTARLEELQKRKRAEIDQQRERLARRATRALHGAQFSAASGIIMPTVSASVAPPLLAAVRPVTAAPVTYTSTGLPRPLSATAEQLLPPKTYVPLRPRKLSPDVPMPAATTEVGVTFRTVQSPTTHADTTQNTTQQNEKRPGTPTASAASVDFRAADAAALLQRLMRGRAIQTALWLARARRQGLVAELRAIDKETDISLTAPAANRVTLATRWRSVLLAVAGAAFSQTLVRASAGISLEKVRIALELADIQRRHREMLEAQRRRNMRFARQQCELAHNQVMEQIMHTANLFVTRLTPLAVNIAARQNAVLSVKKQQIAQEREKDRLAAATLAPISGICDDLRENILARVELETEFGVIKKERDSHLDAARLCLNALMP